MTVDSVLGTSRLRDAFSTVEVKGTLFASRQRILHERWGAIGLATVVDALDPAAAQMLRHPPFATTWQPLSTLLQIDCAIVAVLLQGDARQMRDIGADVARHDLSNLYRTLLRIGNPDFTARRINVAYATYVRTGEMVTESFSPGRARVVLRGAVLPRYFCEHHISGWMDAALVLSGATATTAAHTRCRHRDDEACEWDLRWTG